MPRTANKGEWSEIYVFFKLVAERILASADENLQSLANQSFNVLKIRRTEGPPAARQTIEYDLSLDVDSTTIEKGGLVSVVEIGDLRNGVRQIFESIKNGQGSFSIPLAEEYMEIYGCTSIKAGSGDKSDIHLVIHDRFSPREIDSGFSIKTAYQASATLLNASQANTSFKYEIIGDEQKGIPEQADRVSDTVKSVYDAGHNLNFVQMEGETFRRNVRRIDGHMPEILAAMLAHYYRKNGPTLKDICGLLPNDPTLTALDYSAEDYEYKIKQFLEAIALGMTPATDWGGRNDANGGYIIVKDDGDLACFHLYNRESFLDYLFNNTKFDTPSTSRHGFGDYLNEGGRNYLQLNMQIRFL